YSRIVEWSWILGMVDTTTNEMRMAICSDNSSDAVILFNLISQHVEVTSTIHTDAALKQCSSPRPGSRSPWTNCGAVKRRATWRTT
ncbi:hypothetical protein L9F63_022964, partial [Diploptera punctata]